MQCARAQRCLQCQSPMKHGFCIPWQLMLKVLVDLEHDGWVSNDQQVCVSPPLPAGSVGVHMGKLVR